MVKEKPNSTRIYDKDGYRRRAACICVRSEAEAEVLLVTSSRRPELWIVPGGGVEPDEESSLTATREVLEEAGVIGELGRCLGIFENSEHMHRTEVFVMVVTQELDEWEDSKTIGRKRQWFTIEEALTQLALHKPTQRHYLLQLRHSKNNSSPTENCIHVVTDEADDEPEGVPTSATTKINENRTKSPPPSPPPQPPLTEEDGPTSAETEDQPAADTDELSETTS
ncbi:diphosphoinositol polyphosphate phosphohydrolase 1-like [Armigeres subalbatus]|uniref:diphosphoinositol polyphosphate phosphohydrolase 1-like n=1 Tax=Armigeres subalbatus TaxID=124917 RepID=UPI002ED68B43